MHWNEKTTRVDKEAYQEDNKMSYIRCFYPDWDKIDVTPLTIMHSKGTDVPIDHHKSYYQ